jgi:guanylate kinase
MDESKKEKLVILGKSGSGKDYLMRKLVEKGLKGCLKMTTRPQRKNETQGITYNFVNDNQFIELIKENKFFLKITDPEFTADDVYDLMD